MEDIKFLRGFIDDQNIQIAIDPNCDFSYVSSNFIDSFGENYFDPNLFSDDHTEIFLNIDLLDEDQEDIWLTRKFDILDTDDCFDLCLGNDFLRDNNAYQTSDGQIQFLSGQDEIVTLQLTNGNY